MAPAFNAFTATISLPRLVRINIGKMFDGIELSKSIPFPSGNTISNKAISGYLLPRNHGIL